MRRARSRDKRKASWVATTAADDPVNEPAESMPKSFDFASRRKARPRSFDKNASRNRRAGRSGASTSSRGSSGSKPTEDSHGRPVVTSVAKSPVGQSAHSNVSSVGSFEFSEEADLFGEEFMTLRRSIL
jgi:hypothetical protein